MGTRSNTLVYDDGVQVLNMYRQMDGYLEGHGAELAAFLLPITTVNGIGDYNANGIANGAGCLAAQLVAHFKDGVGGIYLQAPMPDGEHDNDFTYVITPLEGKPTHVAVYEYGAVVFDGTAAQLNQHIAKGEAA